MKSMIDQYIESKSHSWEPTTIKSESSRLHAHVIHLNDEPLQAFEKLSKTMKPYSIKTTFIRITCYFDWLIANGHRVGVNPWKQFMKDNERLFKHVYESKIYLITFDQAHKLISEQVDCAEKKASLQLLEAGLRICETKTFDGKKVIGKGQKPREVFVSKALRPFRYLGTYNQLYRWLKKLGLTPHSLRALCATKFGNIEGVNDIDLMKAFGWNDIETSKRYRQAKASDALANVFKKVRKSE